MVASWDMKSKDLKKLERGLKDFAGKQYPRINGEALNRTAFETSKKYKDIVKRRFTLRNKGTMNSIRFNKVKGFNVNTQESSAGSTMPYMEQQEFGGSKVSRGKKGLGIPTATASNESMGARPRKKQVSRPRRLSSIRLSKSSVKAKNRKQHVFLTIRAAAAKKSGAFVYLPIQGAKGIYRVTGKGERAKIKMIYSLSKKSMPIKKAPSLFPAVNNIIKKMPQFYEEATFKRVGKSFN